MIRKSPLQLAILGVFVLILAGMISAVAAANTVPQTRLASRSAAITANTLKPTECAALNLTAVIVCPDPDTGDCIGTGANELILGGTKADTIKGRGGNDCILGGDGDDDISGNGGKGDVCIGGPGTDTFNKCETVIQ